MADCTINQVPTDFGCVPNDPVGFVQSFYQVGLPFVGSVALISLMIGGYVIMTSRGDPQRVNSGKSWIFYGIGGLLLAIFGYVFLETILVDIFKVPGFS